MTIEVTVKNSLDSPETGHMFCQVAVVSKDCFGNNTTTDVAQLAPGEEKAVYIHSACELRVYESALSLAK